MADASRGGFSCVHFGLTTCTLVWYSMQCCAYSICLSLSVAGYICTVCSSVLSVPGSRSASTSVLAELQKLLQAEATLEEKENQLADISQQIQKIEKAAAKYVYCSMTVYA